MADVPLYTLRAALVSSVLGSTTTEAPRVAQLLDEVLADRELRATRMALLRDQRTGRIRAGVVQALGALPVNHRNTASAVMKRIARAGPEQFGLSATPDVATVRKCLRRILAERQAGVLTLEPPLSGPVSFQTLRIASTRNST